jgi:hypothetical protein
MSTAKIRDVSTTSILKAFLFAVGGILSGGFAGRSGTDRARGANKNNSWRITGDNAGDLDGMGFTGIEEIEGGADEDTFELADGAMLAGSIAGGLGDDLFRVSNSSMLNGTLDGGEGDDTIVGSDDNSNWLINGANAGEVNGLAFFNTENLTGGAGNEDEFRFLEGGSLAGIVDGGAAGFDTVITEGDYSSLIYSASGTDSGSINLDGNVIHYVGMEPIINLSGEPDEVIFEAFGGNDNIIVEDDLLNTGFIKIRSADSPPGFEEVSFATPATSLEIRSLGGDDTIVVKSLSNFDTAVRTLTIKGGDGNDVIDVSEFGAVNTGSISRVATLMGEGDNDVLIGGLGDDTYEGGAGTDTIDLSSVQAYIGAAVTITNTTLQITRAEGGENNTVDLIERAILIGDSSEFDASGFDHPAVLIGGVPTWQSMGPESATNGYVRLGSDTADERLVTGAIQDVAAHPTDSNVIYVATVNGGVYKTTDGGAHWKALTSYLPTLSMSTITIDKSNPNIIYAGTGKTSSYQNQGGNAIGVLKSTDAGETWQLLHKGIEGQRVTGIVAKGGTLIVSTDKYIDSTLYIWDEPNRKFVQLSSQLSSDGSDNDGDGRIDEFSLKKSSLSIDSAGDGYKKGDRVTFNAGGASSLPTMIVITDIDITDTGAKTGTVKKFRVESAGEYQLADIGASAATTAIDGSGTGLTLNIDKTKSFAAEPLTGQVTDMVAENVGGTLTIFVGIQGYGVFMSDDSGATWTDINHNLPDNIITQSTRVRLAVSEAGSQPVYAAFIDTQPDGKDRVSAVYRLGNPSAAAPTWSLMDLPGGPNAATDPRDTTSPSGQALKHFSFVADPADANVVYVGGDTSPSKVNGTYTANMWRGDATEASGSQWETIVNTGANNTSPHPDSRNMVFDVAGNILQVDDGGIYKLLDPDNSDGDREWVSLIGEGLSLLEALSIAYDPVNDVVIMGAQDNGVVMQSSTSPTGWVTVQGGDGQGTAVSIDGSDTRFFSAIQKLNRFFFIDDADPTTKTNMEAEIQGTGWFDDTNLKAFETNITRFFAPMVVNQVNPDRLMVGTHYIYEADGSSFDFENLFSSKPDSSIDFDLYGDPAGDKPPVDKHKLDETGITSLIYGGYTLNAGGSRVGNEEVAYAATSKEKEIYVRRTEDGEFQLTDFHTKVKQTALQMVAHPDDWKQIFVVTTSGVWHGKLKEPAPDTGDVEYAWTNLTGNLVGKSGGIASKLKAIEIYQKDKEVLNNADDDKLVLLVGGLGGVFKAEVDLNAMTPESPNDLAWSEFGANMPNQLVSDLDYNAANNKLFAATIGRGVFVIDNVRESLGDVGTLSVQGTSGSDAVKLVRDADSPWMINVLVNGDLLKSVQAESISNIDIKTYGDDDIIQIDRTNGPIYVSGNFSIDGGAGSNDLDLQIFENLRSGQTLAAAKVDVSATKVDIIKAEDLYGITHTQEINISNVTPPTGEITVDESAIDSGLGDFFNLASNSAGDSMRGQNLAGLDGASILSGLGGTLVELPNHENDRSGAIVSADLDGLALVDAGTNFLKQFFESGPDGFNLDAVLADGANALGGALQGLDSDGLMIQTGTDFTDVSYELQLTRTLDGMVDLNLVGDALISQLGITDIADALSDVIQFSGSVAFSADITIDLTFGIDSSGFYVEVDDTPGQAEISVSNIQFAGEARVRGQFGFLAVELNNLGLALDPGVLLQLDVSHSGGSTIRAEELADINVAFDIDSPGTADATFTADLAVLAEFPGLDFAVFETDVAIAWADISASSFELSTAGADALDALNFLKLNPQELLNELRNLKSDLVNVINEIDDFNIPVIGGSLTDYIDIEEIFDERILSFLELSPTASFETAQGLVSSLASSLTNLLATDEFDETIPAQLEQKLKAEAQNVIRNFSDLGLAYTDGKLTYQVDAEYIFFLDDAIDLGFDLDGGLAEIATTAEFEIEVSAGFSFQLGIDLANLDFSVGSLLDNLFIRNAVVSASLDFSVSDLDALARIGFLDLQVVNGALTADFEVSLGLTDAVVGNDDGFLTFSEIGNAFTESYAVTDLLDGPNLDGTISATLPFAAPFIGIEVADVIATPADYTLGLDVTFSSDPADEPVVAIVTPPPNLDFFNKALDFDNLSAADLATMLGRISDYLDNVSDSKFADTKIPFTSTRISDLLSYQEAFADFLLFDDGDSDARDDESLIGDINAALAAAGLAGSIRAESRDVVAGDATRIAFVAEDLGIGEFKVRVISGTASETYTGLSDSELSSDNYDANGDGDFTDAGDGDRVNGAFGQNTLKEIVGSQVATGTDLSGGDIQLEIQVDGGEWTTVTINNAALDNNSEVGIAEARLLFGNNAATFVTANELAARLTDILGLPLGYNSVSREIYFDLDVVTLFDEQFDIPLDFNVDLSPFAELTSNTNLSLRVLGEIGDSGADGIAGVGESDPNGADDLKLRIGVSLGDADPSSLIQTDTLLTALNGGDGVDIKTAPSLFGAADVQTSATVLSADATFKVFVNGSSTASTITLQKAATLNNLSEADLASDLNNNILIDGVAGSLSSLGLVASVVDSRITFTASGATTSFRIESSTTDPASRELGLGAAQASQQLGLTAIPSASLGTKLVFDIDDEGKAATFTLDVDGTEKTITVLERDTNENSTAADLVSDINDALQRAGLGGQIHALLVSGDVNFVAVDDAVTAFSLSVEAGDPAITELGFAASATAAAGTVAADTIVATNDLRSSVGRIGQNISFQVSIDGGTAVTVNLFAVDGVGTPDLNSDPAVPDYVGVDTASNTSIIDLASDINRALRNATLQDPLDADRQIPETSQLRVDASGDRLLFTGGTGVTSFVITAATSAARSALGLSASDTSDADDLILQIHDGTVARIALDGATTVGDVIERIVTAPEFSGSGNLTPVTTLTQAATGLAADFEQATNTSTFELTDTNGVIVGAIIEVVGFGKAANNGLFEVTVVSANTSIEVKRVDGRDAKLVDESGTSTAELRVTNLVYGDVVVGFTDNGTGLQLTDAQSPAQFDKDSPSSEFMLAPINGSSAAYDLLIVGVEGRENLNGDTEPDGDPLIDRFDGYGVIGGGQVMGPTILDRFFVENAIIGAELTLEAGPGLDLTADDFATDDPAASDDIDISATFGNFLSVGLQGDGALSLSLATGLKDPDTGVLGDRVTLSELIRGITDIGSVIETPQFAVGGGLNLGLTLEPDIPLVDISSLPRLAINLTDFGIALSGGSFSLTEQTLSSFGTGSSFKLRYDLSGVEQTISVPLPSFTGTESSTAFLVAIQTAIDTAAGASKFVASFDDPLGLGTSFKLVLKPATSSGIEDFSIAEAEGAAASVLGFDALDFGALSNQVSSLLPDINFSGWDATSLGDLLDFSNLDFDFGAILDALIMLADFLGQFEEFEFLDQDIPLLNFSFNDALDFADQLDAAITEAQANPAGAIQELELKLEAALGITDPSLLVLSLDDTLDLDGDTQNEKIFKISLDLQTAYTNSVALSVPGLNIPGLGSAIDLGGNADVGIDANLTFGLDLGINLADPTEVILYSSSGLQGNVTADASDLEFTAALLGAGLFVKDGEAGLFGVLEGGLDTDGDGVLEFESEATAYVDLATLLGDLSVIDFSLSGGLGSVLPVYFPIESVSQGEFIIAAGDAYTAGLNGLSAASASSFAVTSGDLSGLSNGTVLQTANFGNTANNGLFKVTGVVGSTISVTALDGSAATLVAETPAATSGAVLRAEVDFDSLTLDVTIPTFDLDLFSNLGLFDSVLLAVDGIDIFLGGLQDLMDGEIFGFELPFIGDNLSAGAGFIEDFRVGFLADFRQFVETAKDLADEFTDEDLNVLSVELFKLLGPAGLNILLEAPGDLADVGDAVGDVIGLNTDGENYIEWDLSIGGMYDIGAEIDFDFGIPGFGIEAEGGIGLAFDWSLDFGFGLSLSEGFYLLLNEDSDPSDPELEVALVAQLPDRLTGRLAGLALTATDSGGGQVADLGLAFAVDINNKSNATDGKLSLAEFGKLNFDVKVAAAAVADLNLVLGLDSTLFGISPSIAAGIPEVQADLLFQWGLGTSTFDAAGVFVPDYIPISDVGNAIKDGLQLVAFENVALDVGSFLKDVLGPVVNQVKKITDPVQPLIDIITAPLPVISDLGPTVTLLDLAASFGKVDPGLIYSIADIISLINRIPNPDEAGELLLPFGNFVVFDRDGTGAEAHTELWNPNFKRTGEGGALSGLLADNGLNDLDFDALLNSSSGDAKAKSTMKDLRSGEAGGGFSFPLFDDPSQIFGLLMGDPATLIQYDMAPLIFEFEWSQFFSIWGPLGVSVGIEFGADIDFDFGYDTLGIQQFVESDFRNFGALVNGFFIGDLVDGVDVPEVELFGRLWAAAELNLGVARAGVGGGITAEVDFNLNDPNGDGKVRIEELIGNFENQLNAPTDAEKLLAPLAVFDVTGRIYAELFAFLKINLLFFKVDKEFPITPELVLVDFDIDFFRPPKLATELDNGDLILNIGDFSENRLRERLDDFAEHIIIAGDGANSVKVKWGNSDLGSDATEWQSYDVGAGGKIIVIGGAENDIIEIDDVGGLIAFDFEVEGGAGDDRINLAAMTGVAMVRGDDGDDIITTGAGADIIFGGLGADKIHAGDGFDQVFGDGGEIIGTNAAGEVAITDGNDLIVGGGANDLLIGGGGDDIIIGGNLAPAGNPFAAVDVDDDDADGDDIILGDGGRVVVDGNIAGWSVTRTQSGSIGGNDELLGNGGMDRIFGGLGDDRIDGGADSDALFGEMGDDTIFGGSHADLIEGADGDDTIDGMRGSSSSWANFDSGDTADDYGDQIFGNAGIDTIGGGDDVSYANTANNVVYQSATPAKPIVGDFIRGNAGDDTIDGEGGIDQLFGDGGDDTIYGGDDSDVIFGGADDDTIFGEDGADKINIGVGSDIADGGQDGDKFIVRFLGGKNDGVTTITDVDVDGDLTVPNDGEDIIEVFTTNSDDQVLLRASATTDNAFIALLNEANAIERVNYDGAMESFVLHTLFGDDIVAFDDSKAVGTVNLGLGDDFIQIGQIFRSPRDASAGIDNNDIVDDFNLDIPKTILTTRGYLTNGVSEDLTVNGGIGNDEFVVYHNEATLALNGNDGDDLFLIKAFALAGSKDDNQSRMDLSGGGGADTIQYVVNAPVFINGGDGFDRVIIIGTEFKDKFVVTDEGVFGAGLNVNYINIEGLVVDGAEGDDSFFVQSTDPNVLTEITGGLGSDTFSVGGDTPAVSSKSSNDLKGHSGLIVHGVESMDSNYQGIPVGGISANVADNDAPGIVVTPLIEELKLIEGGVAMLYTIVLTRAPTSTVTIKALAPKLAPDETARGFETIIFQSGSAGSGVVATTVPVDPLDPTGPQRSAATITFTTDDWYIPKTIVVEAVDDLISEGPFDVAITHTVSALDTIVNVDVDGNVVDAIGKITGNTLEMGADFFSSYGDLTGAVMTITDPSGVALKRVVESNTNKELTLIGDGRWLANKARLRRGRWAGKLSDVKYACRHGSGLHRAGRQVCSNHRRRRCWGCAADYDSERNDAHARWDLVDHAR